MEHLIHKVIFDSEYFQPGVAVFIETKDTRQQGLIYRYAEDILTILKVQDVMTEDNQMRAEPIQISIDVNEVENGEIKLWRIDDMRSINQQKLKGICEKLTRAYMSLSSSLSEQERLLADQNNNHDYSDIEEREQNRAVNFKALIKSFSSM